MKRSDIKIGEDYAYADYSYAYENGTANRVRVVSFDGSQRTIGGELIIGTLVNPLNPDGSIRQAKDGSGLMSWVVKNRDIREPWAPYAARWMEIRSERRKQEARTKLVRRARAQRLLDIIPALRHKGIEDTPRVMVVNDQVVALLDEYVPDIVARGDNGWAYITAPLARSIEDYVWHGSEFKISADDLLKVSR